MKVWANDVEEAAWREKWCDRCFQQAEAEKRIHSIGDGCPLLLMAAHGVPPAEWKKRRNAVMGDTYICSQHLKRTAVLRRRVVEDKTIPLFDPPEHDGDVYVPVEGWPAPKSEETGRL
jgi:hypothetical protein